MIPVVSAPLLVSVQDVRIAFRCRFDAISFVDVFPAPDLSSDPVIIIVAMLLSLLFFFNLLIVLQIVDCVIPGCFTSTTTS